MVTHIRLDLFPVCDDELMVVISISGGNTRLVVTPIKKTWLQCVTIQVTSLDCGTHKGRFLVSVLCLFELDVLSGGNTRLVVTPIKTWLQCVMIQVTSLDSNWM